MAHKEKYTREQLGICWDIMTGARKFPELACPANTVLNYNLAVMTSKKSA